MPCTKYFWMNGYTQMMGTAAKMMQAAFSTSGLVIETVATPSVWKLSLAATIR